MCLFVVCLSGAALSLPASERGQFLKQEVANLQVNPKPQDPPVSDRRCLVPDEVLSLSKCLSLNVSVWLSVHDFPPTCPCICLSPSLRCGCQASSGCLGFSLPTEEALIQRTLPETAKPMHSAAKVNLNTHTPKGANTHTHTHSFSALTGSFPCSLALFSCCLCLLLYPCVCSRSPLPLPSRVFGCLCLFVCRCVCGRVCVFVSKSLPPFVFV